MFLNKNTINKLSSLKSFLILDIANKITVIDMKTLYLFIIATVLSYSAFAQVSDPEELKKEHPFLRFEPTEVQLGTHTVDEMPDDLGEVNIEVHNDGAKPLILNRVSACCGTRVKEWPSEPIAPGEKGTIEVSFRVAPRAQRISRTVTAYSNAANGNMLRVRIKGEIVMAETSESELDLR